MQGVMRKRILCLDVGDKRIGAAVSDPLGLTAQGVATFSRSGFKSDCEAVLQYAREYDVSALVIGLPLDLENREGPQAKKVRFFAEGLGKFLRESGSAAEIKFWDESFSSRDAHDFLIGLGTSRAKRKKAVDRLSAVFILQSYLEAHPPGQ